MSEYGKLAKNTVIFAVGQFSIKLIQFFLMPLLTIALTTGEYGSAETIISIAELLIPLGTLGLQDAVFRFCMRSDIEKKAVLSSTVPVVLSGVVLVALGAAFASSVYSQINCIIFVFLYISYALTNIFGQYIRGCGYIKTFAASGIVQALSLAACTAIFVLALKKGATGYLFSMTFSYFAAVIMMFFAGKVYKSISLKSIDKDILKNMIIYALPLIPSSLSWWCMQVANRYIIIGFIGDSAAGLFISSAKIATIINIFGTIFLQAWTISTVNSLKDKNKSDFNTKIFLSFSAFVQASAFVLLLLLPFVSKFLLQGEFYEAWRYSALGIFAAVLSCYTAFFGAFYGANMKTKFAFYSTLAGAITNVACCFVLVKMFGIVGALFANVAGYAVMTVVRVITTNKYSEIKTNIFKEVFCLLLLLSDAVIITFSKGFSSLLFWGLQALLICMFVIVSFKDIKLLWQNAKPFFNRIFKRQACCEKTVNGSENIKEEQNDLSDIDDKHFNKGENK